MDHQCDCKSYDCNLEVNIPLDTAVEIMQNKLIVIVDGCLIGPSEGDELIKAEDGYKIYKPAPGSI